MGKKEKANPLTDEYKKIIEHMFKEGKSAIQIIRETNYTQSQVYKFKEVLGLTTRTNRTFELNDIQKQIFISGKLGDGNYKKNGLYNYYYRESHSIKEYEYLKWKHDILGKDIINKGGIYEINNGGYSKWLGYRYFGYSTITSPTLIEYANLSKMDAILKLDFLGLILFILDDGWLHSNSKSGNLLIAGGVLTEEEKECVCGRFAEYGIDDVHIIGIKSRDISIPSRHTKTIYEYITKYIPKEVDIIKKKFRTVVS